MGVGRRRNWETTMRMLMLVLGLSGCATAEQRGQWEAEAAISRQAPFCERLGYRSGSYAWARCIQDRENVRDSQNRICTMVYGSLICN